VTASEARKVMRILLTADGGCNCCVEDLLQKFVEVWPQHRADCEKVFNRHFAYLPEGWGIKKL
jgi:hypothetical protein